MIDCRNQGFTLGTRSVSVIEIFRQLRANSAFRLGFGVLIAMGMPTTLVTVYPCVADEAEVRTQGFWRYSRIARFLPLTGPAP